MNICVFCGSSPGNDRVYMQQAFGLGAMLANLDIGLVYGGANVGLMGAVADGCLAQGGRVTGVLPHFLQAKEIAHPQLSELVFVETMHERKIRMSEISDAVIAMPGGFGTLEELFEMLTWGQLGLHSKPVALFNVGGFFDPLLRFVDEMVAAGFLKKVYRDLLIVSADSAALIESIRKYEPPVVQKWITKETT
ncbi:TIGR00730 family Rossman fold protein [Pedobacter yulinensis]|uniref:Cytokinin riboside 5'-monophosphate phosphoribohydrolase n=1 Tax=Pedobacter yulinensis TaxID=2126353 RepID=A0A2T3HL32_9SPHI|nr:TIGR00730 family Rossman fold protein [Pedobacter yulinensis]PST83152.1 TIGR00730 family Rossman fold protein [Pedobacter yulinensis]